MKLPNPRRSPANAATFLYAALVGALGGVLAVAFQGFVDVAQRIATQQNGSIVDAGHRFAWWQCVLLPGAGGVLAALIIRALAPRAKPFGIPGIMEAVSVRRRRIKMRPIATRAAASVAVISSGGSVGREGAIVQLSAALASKIARVAGFEPRQHSLMLGCGVAAGMAAAYNAPLAGAFFVMEVILASFAIEIFAPVVVSSVFAALVMRAIRGSDASVYQMPANLSVSGWGPVLLALVLGVIAGVVAFGFQRTLRAATKAWSKLALPLEAKLGLGGLAVGAIGVWLPDVWGNGYTATSEILLAKLALPTVAALFFLKPLATAISAGSGAPGGVFTPTLLLGASLGALFAGAVGAVFPGLETPSAVFTVVGMASLIAGTTHAPIVSMILIVELTNDFGLLLPLVLATVASSLVAKFLARDSIFTESLRARGVPIDVGIEELTLRRIRVSDLTRSGLLSVASDTRLDQVLQKFRETRLDVIYVTADDSELKGWIDLHDVKEFLNREQMGPVLIAADVMQTPLSVTPEMSLADVLEIFDEPELEELPVVELRGEKRILIGRLTRRDVIAALNLEVLQSQSRRTRLVTRGETNYVELPEGYEIAELDVPENLRGVTLEASGLARAKGVTVLSLVERERGEVKKRSADPKAELGRVTALVVMGRREDIDAMRELASRAK